MQYANTSGAIAPGSPTPEPQKDEAPNRATGRGFKGRERESEQAHSEAARREGKAPGNVPDLKRIATCQAKLALLGFTMAPLIGDSFIVSKWGLSRTVADIADAEHFLRRVGGGA